MSIERFLTRKKRTASSSSPVPVETDDDEIPYVNLENLLISCRFTMLPCVRMVLPNLIHI